jgi:hypothetical protein
LKRLNSRQQEIACCKGFYPPAAVKALKENALMSGSNFETLIQEILKQKRIMDQLAEENNELRRQLADLRDGRGIFVDILGQRFALISSNALTNETSLTSTHLPLTEQEEAEEQAAVYTQPTMQMVLTSAAEAPTTAMPEVSDFVDAQPASEPDEADDLAGILTVDAVANGQFEDMAEMPTHPDGVTPIPSSHFEDEEASPATFLDDMTIDAFVATASNPKAVWTPPSINSQRKQTKKLEMDDEEAKAMLRRELIGSFLLE